MAVSTSPKARQASRVRLPDGTMLSLAATSDLRRHQAVLSLNYERGAAACLCVPASVELAICRRETKERVSYYLRSHPGVGQRHASWCIFEGESGTAAAPPPAVVNVGTLRIDGGLSTRESADEEPAATSARDGSRSPAISLQALAVRLWTSAALDRHDPQNAIRASTYALSRVRRAALGDGLRTVQGTLADLLLLVPPGGVEERVAVFAERARRTLLEAAARETRVIVVGEVGPKIAVPSKSAGRMAMKNIERLTDGWHVAWRQAIAAVVLRDPDLSALIRDERARVLAFVLADRDVEQKTLWARRIAFWPVTRGYIPVASIAQLQLAEYLVSAGRAFERPLSEVRPPVPDFVLTDTPGRVPIAVLEAHADSVAERARASGVPEAAWWTWRASEAVPTLPPRRGA